MDSMMDILFLTQRLCLGTASYCSETTNSSPNTHALRHLLRTTSMVWLGPVPFAAYAKKIPRRKNVKGGIIYCITIHGV
jgi:hypothetical protein